MDWIELNGFSITCPLELLSSAVAVSRSSKQLVVSVLCRFCLDSCALSFIYQGVSI